MMNVLQFIYVTKSIIMNFIRVLFAWFYRITFGTLGYYYDWYMIKRCIREAVRRNQYEYEAMKRLTKSRGKFNQYSPHEPAYKCKCDISNYCNICQFKLLHPLQCAETSKDIKRMKQMLNKNPDSINGIPNNCEAVPLVMAIVFEHKKCIQFLVKNGAQLSTPFSVLLTKALADPTPNAKIKLNYIKMINDILIHSTKEQLKLVLASNLIFPLLMQFHSIGINVIESFLKYGADPNMYIQTGNVKLSLLSLTLAYYSPRNSPNKYKLLNTLLEYGTNVNKDIKICDDILFAVVGNNKKALKMLLWYYIPSDTMNCKEYKAVILNIFGSQRLQYSDKIKVLIILNEFGYDVFIGYNNFNLSIDCNDKLNKMRTICSNPISLQSLTRLAIIKTMGPKFRDQYKQLNLPNDLLKFLEFKDLDEFIA